MVVVVGVVDLDLGMYEELLADYRWVEFESFVSWGETVAVPRQAPWAYR